MFTASAHLRPFAVRLRKFRSLAVAVVVSVASLRLSATPPVEYGEKRVFVRGGMQAEESQTEPASVPLEKGDIDSALELLTLRIHYAMKAASAPAAPETRAGVSKDAPLLLRLFGLGQKESDDDHDSDDEQFSPIQTASPNLIIGEIVHVDPERQFAVAWLMSAEIKPAQTLRSRDGSLNETARLNPGGYRDGRAVVLETIEGAPNIGDIVDIPAD